MIRSYFSHIVIFIFSILMLILACDRESSTSEPEPLSETEELGFVAQTITLRYNGNVGETLKIHTPKIVDELNRNIVPVLKSSSFLKVTTAASASTDTTTVELVKAGTESLTLEWSAPETSVEKDVNNDGVTDKVTYPAKVINVKIELNIKAKIPPTKPILVRPKNEAKDITSDAAFVWLSSSDANNDPITYEVQIGFSSSTLQKLTDNLTVTQLAFKDALDGDEGLEANKTIYWRVIAKANGDQNS